MSGEIEKKVVEVIDQLQNLAQPAMQAAIESTRVTGVINLVTGIAAVIVCYFLAKTLAPRLKAIKDSDSESGEVANAVALAALGLGTAALAVSACICLLDTSNWLAAVRPDLELARMLIKHL